MHEYSVRVGGTKDAVNKFTKLAIQSGAASTPIGTVTQYLKEPISEAVFVYKGPNPPELFEAIAADCGVEVKHIGPPGP